MHVMIRHSLKAFCKQEGSFEISATNASETVFRRFSSGSNCPLADIAHQASLSLGGVANTARYFA